MILECIGRMWLRSRITSLAISSMQSLPSHVLVAGFDGTMVVKADMYLLDAGVMQRP
jgi:hypothetical protein